MRSLSNVEKAGIIPALGFALSLSCGNRTDHFSVEKLEKIVKRCRQSAVGYVEDCLRGDMPKKDCSFKRSSDGDHISIADPKYNTYLRLVSLPDESSTRMHLQCLVSSTPNFNDEGRIIGVEVNKSNEGPILKVPEIIDIRGEDKDSRILCSVVSKTGFTTCFEYHPNRSVNFGFGPGNPYEVPLHNNSVAKSSMVVIDDNLGDIARTIKDGVDTHIKRQEHNAKGKE